MDREPLGDGTGRTVATYLRVERAGRPCADLLELAGGATPAAAAAAFLARRRGWLAATEDAALGVALAAAGAAPHRHAFMLELDLVAVAERQPGSPPAGVETAGLVEVPAELGAVQRAAYPVGHPDHRMGIADADAVEQLRNLVLGRAGWTALAGSRIARQGGRAVGAAILTRHVAPAHRGPVAWLAELFRRPGDDLRGLGGVLLDEAVLGARAAGLPAVGLAVSATNPARRLYESRGFVAVAESRTLRA